MNNNAFKPQHNWHFYPPSDDTHKHYEVVSAQGANLRLNNSQILVDGMSSCWSAIHGYNHCALNRAAHEQIDSLAHIRFDGIMQPSASALSQNLLKVAPNDLSRLLLVDSSSQAIETAIKIAIQFWACEGRKEKSQLLSPRGSYFGDAFGAMSISDPLNTAHSVYRSEPQAHFFAPAPQIQFDKTWHPDEIAPMRDILEQHHHKIAAMVIEPIVQSSSMNFYHPEYLKQCRLLCNEFDVLLICDETASGFGRTGELFACDHAQISPDIMVLSNALTGGYVSLGAVLCSEQLTITISDSESGFFMHGSAFMSNPLACTIANASLMLLLNSDWRANVKRIEMRLQDKLMPLQALAQVDNVRCLGAIGVVQMKSHVNAAQIQQDCFAKGALVRPFGKLIYLIPPYVCNDEQIDLLCAAIKYAIVK